MPVKDADSKCTACEPEPEAILVLAPLGERAPRILAAVQLAVLRLDRARALLCSAHDQLLAGGAATHRAFASRDVTIRARKFGVTRFPPPVWWRERRERGATLLDECR